MKTTPIYKVSSILLLSLAVAALSACGKAGMPKPPKTNAEFGWESVNGQAIPNNCIVVSGTMNGAVENLNDVILEIEPINDDSCVGCPFTPREKERFSAWRLGITPSNLSFSRTYCPQVTGDGVRWRFVGTNTHFSVPNAISPEVITIFKGKKMPAELQEILEEEPMEVIVKDSQAPEPEAVKEPDDAIQFPLQ